MGGRRARIHRQSFRDAPRDNMSLLWILLTLLPVLGGAERFNCKGRILGAYYADAKSGCKAFHVCVRVAGGGIRDFRFFCPPGTLFHQEAQTCTDWGDDDPLACPADIYDGQFDLYKIGSGFDTKKISSSGNREDEVEFGLQRAETGDRRLAQNNVAPNRPDSDLRAAHSSDFFSGQRERGRDDVAPTPAAPPSLSPSKQSQQRQSFRRPSSQRTVATQPTTQYTTPAPPSPQPSNAPRYEGGSKRKLVRKRPIFVSTKSPSTTPSTITPSPSTSPPLITGPQQQTFNRRIPSQNKPSFSTPIVPPQFQEYKDEYVEVSRVTPKPKQNRVYFNNSPSTPFVQSTVAPRLNKKDGLVELYNYDANSTPGLNAQNENNFKIKSGFNVQDARRDRDFTPPKNINYNTLKEVSPTAAYSVSAKTFPTSTPTYNNNNFNSVSYEPEKNNYLPYSKVSNFSPSTTVAPVTKTFRPNTPVNLNTIAYNTNNGFHSESSKNAKNGEDDGQYHPPEGEDDGQYKPELYDPELLSGAHSLNIAASGNRLPEDRKVYSKTKAPQKPTAQTAAPRPFRPAPTPGAAFTSRDTETTYSSTQQSQPQRTFDYFQTYTTTSRPTDYLALSQSYSQQTDEPTRKTTAVPLPNAAETRAPRLENRAPPAPSSAAPRPSTKVPHFARPASNKEDNSYDYAYYDSDSGFPEYDHLEEFGKTKTRA